MATEREKANPQASSPVQKVDAPPSKVSAGDLAESRDIAHAMNLNPDIAKLGYSDEQLTAALVQCRIKTGFFKERERCYLSEAITLAAKAEGTIEGARLANGNKIYDRCNDNMDPKLVRATTDCANEALTTMPTPIPAASPTPDKK